MSTKMLKSIFTILFIVLSTIAVSAKEVSEERLKEIEEFFKEDEDNRGDYNDPPLIVMFNTIEGSNGTAVPSLNISEERLKEIEEFFKEDEDNRGDYNDPPLLAKEVSEERLKEIEEFFKEDEDNRGDYNDPPLLA